MSLPAEQQRLTSLLKGNKKEVGGEKWEVRGVRSLNFPPPTSHQYLTLINTMKQNIKNRFNLTISDYVILSGGVINIIVITTIFIFWLIYT